MYMCHLATEQKTFYVELRFIYTNSGRSAEDSLPVVAWSKKV